MDSCYLEYRSTHSTRASASMQQMHVCHLLTAPCMLVQALHAAELAIDHPTTGERMHFSGAPLLTCIRVWYAVTCKVRLVCSRTLADVRLCIFVQRRR